MSEHASTARMANAVRFLAMEAIEKAKSGHPGAPMGMAEIAVALWSMHLKHNPANPHWENRDRFVLSNGHGSMLLYALLHLSGYKLPMQALQQFRQLDSGTPGHPEVDVTPGVETTTGPLGQGLSNAVGMALSEKLLAQEFNRPNHEIVNHFTYTFVGDGCLMEGISHEVCSLAGTLQLGKLIVIYDDNGISIDGDVKQWFTDNTPARFRAYGWNVIESVDGHDVQAVNNAISAARQHGSVSGAAPTLICCKTVIGKGAPNKEGGHGIHGAPVGTDEIMAARQALGWDAPAFEVPEDVRKAWSAKQTGAVLEQSWQQSFAEYSDTYPELAQEFTRRMRSKLPENFDAKVQEACEAIAANSDVIATRKASQNALSALAPILPEFFGGSADLTGSNLTNFSGCTPVQNAQWGNHMSYGVREFGMAAIMNGMALHGGHLPYGGTFLTFSDYSRNAIRMAALMNRRIVHVFTHDSIGLGEDGPTHQSVEHIPSLRLIPNLDVWRPADSLETMVAWISAVKRRKGPSALALSRQGLPVLHSDTKQLDAIAKGGYILRDSPHPQAIIIGTGSETHLALEAQADLSALGISVRVISMPCTSVFERQSKEYKQQLFTQGVPVVVVEAACTDGWYKYTGPGGKIIGINQFGESAPAKTLYAHFGITSQAVTKAVKTLVAR